MEYDYVSIVIAAILGTTAGKLIGYGLWELRKYIRRRKNRK